MTPVEVSTAAKLVTVLRRERTRTLPRYMASGLVLLDDFEDASVWNAGSVLPTDNTTEYQTGTQSLKVVIGGSASPYMQTDATPRTWSLAGAESLRLFCYVHDVTKVPTRLPIYLASTIDLSRCFLFDGYGLALRHGWNTLSIHRSQFSATEGLSWDEVMVRCRIRVYAGEAGAEVSFDTMRVAANPKPGVMFMFDDGLASTHSVALPYMAARRVRGTAYVITDNIDGEGAMTQAQLRDLADAGWTVGNHTASHTDLTTLTQEQQEAEFTTAQAALEAWGLADGGAHVAYPFGKSNADTLAAMTAAGMLTGRTTANRDMVLPYADWRLATAYSVPHTATLADLKARLDRAKERGTIAPLLFHNLVEMPTSSGEWGIADFYALVDYARQIGLPALTVDDLYRLESGAVTIPR